jgi:2-dehydropantoate 2-reductase
VLAGTTCLMRGMIGDIVAADPTLALRMYAECRAIAGAEGYAPSQDFIDAQSRLLVEPGSNFHASMLRDIEAKAPIEAHQIIGDLLERGHRHALATPLLEIVYAHLRTYEERRQREAAAP